MSQQNHEEQSETLLPEPPYQEVDSLFTSSSWYGDIIYYLQNLKCPDHLDKSQICSLKLKETKYCILKGVLYWKDHVGILLRCILEDETDNIINQHHHGVCGGHYAWKATAHNILCSGYYWPTLFTMVNKKVRACLECQLFVGKKKLSPLPLKPIKVQAPFQQWGLDFIGEIHPPSSGQTQMDSNHHLNILQNGSRLSLCITRQTKW
jgi:hypothetical protein